MFQGSLLSSLRPSLVNLTFPAAPATRIEAHFVRYAFALHHVTVLQVASRRAAFAISRPSKARRALTSEYKQRHQQRVIRLCCWRVKLVVCSITVILMLDYVTQTDVNHISVIMACCSKIEQLSTA
jgi:hypothetical protein